MKRVMVCFFFLCLFSLHLNGETIINNTDHSGDSMTSSGESNVSPLLIFHDIGWNLLNSLTYNYGLNFIGAGLGTWACIETGLDWNWRNVAYNNQWLVNMGLPLQFAGYLVPVLTPVPVYLAGLYLSDRKLQITAVALVQALMVTQVFHLSFKMITGRKMPGLISGVFFEPNNTRIHTDVDFSGDFNWFSLDFYDGWPSGHTASAFSAAAVIAEIYDDKPLLKIGVYAYALLMGFSVAADTHWASDSIAGALIGYAVGKVVGKSFNQLLGKNGDQNAVSLLLTPDTVGVRIRL